MKPGRIVIRLRDGLWGASREGHCDKIGAMLLVEALRFCDERNIRERRWLSLRPWNFQE